MKLLLTGFGAFGDVTNNPSERLARHFDGRTIGNSDIKSCILPVSYTRAPALLLDFIDREAQDGIPIGAILMLGVAAGSVGWRVERAARNIESSAADVDGYIPARLIEPYGATVMESTAPVDSILSALARERLPSIISEYAGDYLCNFIFYTALHCLRDRSPRISTAFLHVPSDSETRSREEDPAFPFGAHVTAVRCCIEALDCFSAAV